MIQTLSKCESFQTALYLSSSSKHYTFFSFLIIIATKILWHFLIRRLILNLYNNTICNFKKTTRADTAILQTYKGYVKSPMDICIFSCSSPFVICRQLEIPSTAKFFSTWSFQRSGGLPFPLVSSKGTASRIFKPGVFLFIPNTA